MCGVRCACAQGPPRKASDLREVVDEQRKRDRHEARASLIATTSTLARPNFFKRCGRLPRAAVNMVTTRS